MTEITTILMTVLATDEKNTTNYIIASYIINNLKALMKTPNLTTGYLAKQCNVSKASISRFCRDVGFEDFYTFKYMLKNFYPSNSLTKKYEFSKSKTAVLSDFLTEFGVSMNEFTKRFHQADLDELTRDIHQYKRVIIMGHQQSFAMALTLQNDLGTGFSKFTIVCGDPTQQAEYFEKNSKDDLFIVISATGNFFNHAMIKPKVHKPMHAKIYLLTTNENTNFKFVSKTICIANHYSYPSTIMLNIYIGLISTNYYRLFLEEKDLKRIA